jgi:enoyl-CoA hydratase/carnithine racemase
MLTDDHAWLLSDHAARDVARSADAKEGPRAFLEKRAPNWTGR